ncbi:MAG: hypothetical protein ACRERV_00205 [Methylococcales bacterium]
MNGKPVIPIESVELAWSAQQIPKFWMADLYVIRVVRISAFHARMTA